MFLLCVLRYIGFKNVLVSHCVPKLDTGGEYWARHTGPTLCWAMGLQQFLYICILITRKIDLESSYDNWCLWWTIPLPILTIIFAGLVFGDSFFRWQRLSLEDSVMADAGLQVKQINLKKWLLWLTWGSSYINVNMGDFEDVDGHLEKEVRNDINKAIDEQLAWRGQHAKTSPALLQPTEDGQEETEEVLITFCKSTNYILIKCKLFFYTTTYRFCLYFSSFV